MQSFAVVPAAGFSVRMGRPKLLMPWGKSTVIEHVLAAWRDSSVHHVVVVVRRADQELARNCRGSGALVVEADPPPEEMRTSVQWGLDAIRTTWRPQQDDVWLLAPADMPTLTSAVIEQVLSAHRPESPAIIVPRHGERRGHPVLFPWKLAAEVKLLPPGQGLRALLKQFAVRDLLVAEPIVLEDLDTPSDYERLSRLDRPA